MELSFTQKKSIRKSFGRLKETLSIPNLIEVQKNSFNEFIKKTDQKANSIYSGMNMKERQMKRLILFIIRTKFVRVGMSRNK